jgi:hypothetical protein
MGQGVVHCVLKHLFYNLADMHKITPNIHEVIAFTKWLSAKQSLPKSGLKSVLYSHICTLGINTSLAPNFIQICTLVDHVIRNNFSFESGD